MDYKVNRGAVGMAGRRKVTGGQASQAAGGWRGFGLNQVHNIESSCCVMQSDDEDREERDQERAADHGARANQQDGAFSLDGRSLGLSPSHGHRSRKSGPRLAVNSSRISEASSKYRISADGQHQEHRQRSIAHAEDEGQARDQATHGS